MNDVFAQIRALLNADSPSGATKTVASDGGTAEKQKKTANADVLGAIQSFIDSLRKEAEALDARTVALVKSCEHLLSRVRQDETKIAEIETKNKAREMAESLFARGAISYDDIPKYAEEIARDIPAWSRAINFVGMSAFSDRSLKLPSDMHSQGSDPLLSILLEAQKY